MNQDGTGVFGVWNALSCSQWVLDIEQRHQGQRHGPGEAKTNRRRVPEMLNPLSSGNLNLLVILILGNLVSPVHT